MKNDNEISASERQVMEVVWKMGKASFQEIKASLLYTNWSRNTITTLLGRLVKKGFLSTEGNPNKYLYFPMVPEEEYRKQETQAFLSKAYAGSAKLLVTSFIKDKALTEEDADELMAILDEYRKGES